MDQMMNADITKFITVPLQSVVNVLLVRSIGLHSAN